MNTLLPTSGDHPLLLLISMCSGIHSKSTILMIFHAELRFCGRALKCCVTLRVCVLVYVVLSLHAIRVPTSRDNCFFTLSYVHTFLPNLFFRSVWRYPSSSTSLYPSLNKNNLVVPSLFKECPSFNFFYG